MLDLTLRIKLPDCPDKSVFPADCQCISVIGRHLLLGKCSGTWEFENSNMTAVMKFALFSPRASAILSLQKYFSSYLPPKFVQNYECGSFVATSLMDLLFTFAISDSGKTF